MLNSYKDIRRQTEGQTTLIGQTDTAPDLAGRKSEAQFKLGLTKTMRVVVS